MDTVALRYALPTVVVGYVLYRLMGSGSSSASYTNAQYAYANQWYEDHVAGLPSLEGKAVAVTGSSTGLGLDLAKTAAKKGASLILMLNRPSDRATSAEAAVRSSLLSASAQVVETIDCDLSQMDSVRAAARKLLNRTKQHGGLDVLLCNAGVMAYKDVRTADGYDVQAQTNQLSHLLLANMVWPALEEAASKRGDARISFQSSSARDQPPANLAPEYFRKCEPGTLGGDENSFLYEMVTHAGPWSRYHQSKLANAAFAMALHDKLQERGSKVKASATDPGLAATMLQDRSTRNGLMPVWLAKLLFGYGMAQTSADGSTCMAEAAFASASGSGDFFAPAGASKGPPTRVIAGGVPVKARSEKLSTSQANKDAAWATAEEFLGGSFFTALA